MEHRSLSLVAGLILGAGCLFSGGAAWAQSEDEAKPTQEQRADWDRRLQEAKEVQKDGSTRNKEAKAAFEARKLACFKKFRVNSCQHEARQEYLQSANEARRIENEGKALERQVRKEELADKDARRLAQEPQREADMKDREAETRAEREQAESLRAAKIVHKEEQARAGAERQAAAEERRRKKQEDHDRKVAEKMEKARQREAEAGR